MENADDISFVTATRSELSEDNEQTIVSLYQRCPHLWGDFKTLVDFLDTLDTQVVSQSTALSMLANCASKVNQAFNRLYPHDDSVKDLGHFAALIGFVDQSVSIYRQQRKEPGQGFLTDLSMFGMRADLHGDILRLVRALLLNFSLVSMHFSLRLFQTGFLQDILGDLRHAQNSADASETKEVFLHSAGLLHNWCRHTEVLPLVKQNSAAIVTVLTPFRETTCGTQVIPTITLTVLSFIVDDDQVDLLRLRADALQYLLGILTTALELHKAEHDHWRIDAILCGLLGMLRYEFNRRLLTAQGTPKILKRVLAGDRSDRERQAAIDILHVLTKDPHNFAVLQNDRDLTRVLTTVSANGSEGIRDSAKKVLSRIRRVSEKDCEDRSSSPSLDGLLAEELNMLCILGMGEVEYVMDRLTEVTAEGGGSNGTCCLEVLQALTELVCRDDGCRREIMARGALDHLTKILQNGGSEEKTQAVRILLELTFCEENREIMKSQPDLMVSLSDATVVTDNVDLAQTASNILQAFGL